MIIFHVKSFTYKNVGMEFSPPKKILLQRKKKEKEYVQNPWNKGVPTLKSPDQLYVSIYKYLYMVTAMLAEIDVKSLKVKARRRHLK